MILKAKYSLKIWPSLLLGLGFLLLFLTPVTAQTKSNIVFNKRYDLGFANTVITSIVEIDTGYMVSALVVDSASGETGLAIVNVDDFGEVNYMNTFFQSGKDIEVWEDALIKTKDGGFATCGYVQDTTGRFSIVFKFDAIGDTLFTRSFGHPDTVSRFVYPSQILEFENGDMYIVEQVLQGNLISQASVTRLDSMGQVIWQVEHGDTLRDWGMCAIQIDSAKLLLGSLYSNYGQVLNNHIIRARLYEVDSTGTFSMIYESSGEETFAVNDVALMPNGSCVYASANTIVDGNNNLEFQCLGVKLDDQLEEEWRFSTQEIHTPSTQFKQVVVSNDNKAVFGGQVWVIADTASVIHSYGRLSKVDLDGSLIWDRYYFPISITTQFDNNFMVDLKQTSDGGYIFCGQARDAGVQYQGQQGWLLKTDSLGCLVPGCGSVGIDEQEPTLLKLYPNPANDMVYLHFNKNVNTRSIVLYSMSGEEVGRYENLTTVEGTGFLSVHDFPSGIYLLHVIEDGMVTGKEKLVIQH